MLAALKDDTGRITIEGFYDGIVIDDDARAVLEAVPETQEDLRKKIGIAEAYAVLPNPTRGDPVPLAQRARTALRLGG